MTVPAIHPRIAISTISTWRNPLEQDVALMRELGVGALGLISSKADGDPVGAGAAISAAGLKASCVTAAVSGVSLIDLPDAEGSPTLRLLTPSFDLAAALGGVPCYFTSGPTPKRMPTDLAFDALVAALPPVVDYARAAGVRLALEHNHASTRQNGFVQSLRDGIELSQATGVDVCLELQNCWTERHLPAMFREHIGRFAVVQVSDYRIGETTQMNRRVLGDGDIPLEWMLGLLLDAGFPGYFEIETLGPAIEAEGYAPALARSVAWLNERLIRWGV